MNGDLKEFKQNLKKGILGKVLPLTLAGSIAFGSSLPSKKAYAYNLPEPTISCEEFQNYEYTKMFLGGRQIEFTKETGVPYKKSKKLMVPLEAFANAYFGTYTYDKETGVAELSRFDTTINMKSKSKKIIIQSHTYKYSFKKREVVPVNEKSLKAKVATTVKNGKVYVQLSTLAEALGLSVRTDKKTGIIHVEFKDNFKNIDFKEKKITTIKSVNKSSVNKLMLDWVEVPTDYIDILKKSSQYKVFVENNTAYVFSYQFLYNLNYFYTKNKEFQDKVKNETESSHMWIDLDYLISDQREFLDERDFFKKICNFTAYDFCWSTDKYDDLCHFSAGRDPEEYNKALEVAKKIADDIKKKNVSQREQVKLACEAICDIAEYDRSYVGTGAYEALVVGKTVCSGYEEALEMVLFELQIPYVNVMGEGVSEKHTWAHVYADDKWFLVDPTYYDDLRGRRLFLEEPKQTEKEYKRTVYNEDELDLFQLTYKFY